MSSTAGRFDSGAIQAHRDELYGFVLKRVRDPEAADDIVQDVFVKALSKRDQLEDPAKLRGWLYQVTRHAIIDDYRARTRASQIAEEYALEGITEEDDRTRRELARCLLPLIDGLPPPYREALLLVEFEGVAQTDLATRLGLSPSGAKSRVQRARKMLLDAVLKCCRVELDARGGVVDYEPRRSCDC